jgi:SagB-type dehydrogenase family enzyme
LPEQTLSDLIWAAYGINRPDSGKRTAPSALNKQEIDLYVVMKDGAYFYNAKEHRLELIAGKDIRKLSGKQGFVKNAAVNLVYVADMKRSAGDDTEERLVYAGSAAGFIGQNVYLFCASEGLATVIRAYIDREQLGRALKLKPKHRIILSQSVGYSGE